MKEQDYIADLFRESLENHEVPVRPEIWQNVASRIQPSAPAGDGSVAQQASVATKATTGITGWISGTAIVVTGVAGIVAYSIFKNPEPETIVSNQPVSIPAAQTVVVSPVTEASSEYQIPESPVNVSENGQSVQLNPGSINSSESTQAENTDINISTTDNNAEMQSASSQQTEVVSPLNNSNRTDLSAQNSSTQVKVDDPATENLNDVADPIPLSKLRIHADATEGVAPFESSFYVAAASGNAEWTFEPSSVSAEGLAVRHRFEKPGTYEATCKYTDANGTISIERLTITVKPAFLLSVNANVLTPNGDGLNDEFVVKSLEDIEIELAIFDSNGKQIFRDKGTEITWNGRINSYDYASSGGYNYIIFANGELIRKDKVTILK